MLQQLYDRFHNILRLFDVLPNLLFTTSETIGDIICKHAIYELPNDVRLRKLGNIRKVSKYHRMIA